MVDIYIEPDASDSAPLCPFDHVPVCRMQLMLSKLLVRKAPIKPAVTCL